MGLPLAVAIAYGGSKVLDIVAKTRVAQGEIDALKRQARWLRMQAGYTFQEGAFAAAMKQIETSRLASAQGMEYAASNVEIGGGGAVSDTLFFGELEASNIKLAAARQARGQLEQAKELSKRARSMKRLLPLQVLLGTAEAVGSGYTTYSALGGPPAKGGK